MTTWLVCDEPLNRRRMDCLFTMCDARPHLGGDKPPGVCIAAPDSTTPGAYQPILAQLN